MSTRYEYDDSGNLVREVAELYDADRNVVGEQSTTYYYDQFGNNTGTETSVGGGEAPITTSSVYDIFGNRTEFKDGNGQTTEFIYDNDNRLLQTIDPLNRITTFTYDAVGNVTTFTDAKGFQTVNVYDRNNNLLTSTELGDGTASRTVTRVYDVLGNVTSLQMRKGGLPPTPTAHGMNWSPSRPRALLMLMLMTRGHTPHPTATIRKATASPSRMPVVMLQPTSTTRTTSSHLRPMRQASASSTPMTPIPI